jgi:hypothetical protein
MLGALDEVESLCRKARRDTGYNTVSRKHRRRGRQGAATMNTGYPTLNFGLGEDIDMLRDAVHQMCERRSGRALQTIDRDNDFPMDLWP